MGELPARLAELDPARPIACLCHHGARSLRIGLVLAAPRVEHLANITGGIDAWSHESDPAVPLLMPRGCMDRTFHLVAPRCPPLPAQIRLADSSERPPMTPFRLLSLSILSLALGAACCVRRPSRRACWSWWSPPAPMTRPGSRHVRNWTPPPARPTRPAAGLLPSAALTGGLTRSNVELSKPKIENTGYGADGRHQRLATAVPPRQPDHAGARPARCGCGRGAAGRGHARPAGAAGEPGLLRCAGGARHLTAVQAQKAAVSEQLAAAKRNFDRHHHGDRFAQHRPVTIW